MTHSKGFTADTATGILTAQSAADEIHTQVTRGSWVPRTSRIPGREPARTGAAGIPRLTSMGIRP
jgi:hypothetical protein